MPANRRNRTPCEQGFAERKVLLLREVIGACLVLHEEAANCERRSKALACRPVSIV